MKKLFKLMAVLLILASPVFGQSVGVRFSKVQIRNWLEVAPTVQDTNLYHTYIGVFDGLVKFNSIVLDNNTSTIPGLIRFDGSHFYGYTGSAWVKLDSAVAGTGGGTGAVTSFLELTDTPSTYSGSGGFLARVNAAGNAIDFINPDLVSTNADQIGGIYLGGNTPSDGQVLKYDAVDNLINWGDDLQGSGTGSSTFLGLTDTPSSYTAGYALRVNANGNALEFIPQSSLTTNASSIQGVTVESTSPALNNVMRYNGTNWAPNYLNFVNLGDTPGYYSNGLILQSTASGIAYSSPDTLKTTAGWIGIKPITKLPPSDGQILKYDSNSDSLTWQADNTGSSSGSSTFLGLDDTPTSYTANYALVVNSAANAVDFIAQDQMSTNAISLKGIAVDAQPTNGQYLEYNGTSWISKTIPTYPTTFLGLDDTPSSYSGNAGKKLIVNTSGDAVIFETDSLNSLSDISLGAESAGDLLKYDGTNWVNSSTISLNEIDNSGNLSFRWDTTQVSTYLLRRGQDISLLNNNLNFIEYGQSNSIVTGMITNGAVTVGKIGIDADLSMQNFSITDLNDPVADQDAATKIYVDNGLSDKIPFTDTTSTVATHYYITTQLAPKVNYSDTTSMIATKADTISLLATKHDLSPLIIQANLVNPDSLNLENNDVMIWQNITGKSVTIDSIVFKATRNSGSVQTIWYGDRFSTASGKTTITQATISTSSGDGMYYDIESGTGIQNASVPNNSQIWITCDNTVDLGELFIIIYGRK